MCGRGGCVGFQFVRTFLLLLFLVVAPGAYAADVPERFLGVSAFAMMHPAYKCDALLATLDFSPRPFTAVLYETFGNDPTCIARFTARYFDKPHKLEIHFLNGPCMRNHNCVDETFGTMSVGALNRRLERMDGDMQMRIALRMFAIRSLADAVKNENTHLVLSPGLEDNYTDEAYRNLLVEIRKMWPEDIVRNPCKGGRSLQGANGKEYHSTNSHVENVACIANEDGNYNQTVKKSAKFIKHYKRCDVLLWRGKHQGRTSEMIPRTDPKKRKFIYTAKDVVELGGLLK